MPSPAAMSFSASASITLCALHSLADPLIRIHARGRIHALGREADDVDDLGLFLLLVEAIGAVSRLGDALMAVTDRHLHMAGRAFELDALEAGCDFIRRRLGAGLGGLLVGELEAEQRLRHLVGGIGRRDVVAVGVNFLEPLVDLAVAREWAVGAARADDRAVRSEEHTS